MSDIWNVLSEEEKQAEEKKESLQRRKEELEKTPEYEKTQEMVIEIHKIEDETKRVEEHVKQIQNTQLDMQRVKENLLIEFTKEIELNIHDSIHQKVESKIITKQYMINKNIAKALDDYHLAWKKNRPGMKIKIGALVEYAIASLIGVGVNEARERLGLPPIEEGKE